MQAISDSIFVWVMANLGAVSLTFLVMTGLNVVLPVLLVTMLGRSLPDPETGFSRLDAVPMRIAQHVRMWRFVFGRRAAEVSSQRARLVLYALRFVLLSAVLVFAALAFWLVMSIGAAAVATP